MSLPTAMQSHPPTALPSVATLPRPRTTGSKQERSMSSVHAALRMLRRAAGAFAKERDGSAAIATAEDDHAPLLASGFLRQLEQMRFAAPRPPTDGLAGEHRSSRRVHAAEFSDYRNYVVGDDIRMIDWNV